MYIYIYIYITTPNDKLTRISKQKKLTCQAIMQI